MGKERIAVHSPTRFTKPSFSPLTPKEKSSTKSSTRSSLENHHHQLRKDSTTRHNSPNRHSSILPQEQRKGDAVPSSSKQSNINNDMPNTPMMPIPPPPSLYFMGGMAHCIERERRGRLVSRRHRARLHLQFPWLRDNSPATQSISPFLLGLTSPLMKRCTSSSRDCRSVSS